MVLTTQRNGFSFTVSASKELNSEERSVTKGFLLWIERNVCTLLKIWLDKWISFAFEESLSNTFPRSLFTLKRLLNWSYRRIFFLLKDRPRIWVGTNKFRKFQAKFCYWSRKVPIFLPVFPDSVKKKITSSWRFTA